MNDSNAAIIPNTKARSVPSAHKPTVVKMPTNTMDAILATSQPDNAVPHALNTSRVLSRRAGGTRVTVPLIYQSGFTARNKPRKNAKTTLPKPFTVDEKTLEMAVIMVLTSESDELKLVRLSVTFAPQGSPDNCSLI